MRHRQRRVFVLLMAPALSSSRLVVVLHATTEAAADRGARIVGQAPKEVQCTLWATQALNVDNAAKRYPPEVESRGFAARVVFGLSTALDVSGSSEQRQSLLSLDLDSWWPCQRFFSFELPKLKRSEGASVATSEKSKEGFWTQAELKVVAATWQRPIWLRRYAAAMSRVLRRDAETPPTSWLANSSATDVAMEARHKIEATTDELIFDDLPSELVCRGACRNECVGALPSGEHLQRNRGATAKQALSATNALLKKVLHDDERLEKCVVMDNKDDDDGDDKRENEDEQKPNEEAAVIVSGVNARDGPNGDSDVDLALNKRAYAKKHGYAFADRKSVV